MVLTEPSSMSEVRAARRAELAVPRLDTRGAVLTALEQLLDEQPLHTLSVARIIEAAGVSRGGFYSYFESKFDAAGALLAQVIAGAFERLGPLAEVMAASPLQGIEAGLRTLVEIWDEHKAIMLAYHQYWPTVPELREQYLAEIERYVVEVAEAIDQARGRGLLPEGEESRRLASAGLWASEQLISVSATDVVDELADREFVIRALVKVWAGLLLGGGWSG